MNRALAAVGHLTGKHIVEHKKRRLAAIGHGDIARRQIPTKLLFEQTGDLFAEVFVALG